MNWVVRGVILVVGDWLVGKVFLSERDRGGRRTQEEDSLVILEGERVRENFVNCFSGRSCLWEIVRGRPGRLAGWRIERKRKRRKKKKNNPKKRERRGPNC